jgi:hypothetical protein
MSLTHLDCLAAPLLPAHTWQLADASESDNINGGEIFFHILRAACFLASFLDPPTPVDMV